jgi:class 3 adenylate cyclase
MQRYSDSTEDSPSWMNLRPRGAEAPATRHAGERRVVTILFCDVAGSTALAETMNPEAWTEIMNAAFELLVEPVERYGGTGTRKARATSCVDKP